METTPTEFPPLRYGTPMEGMRLLRLGYVLSGQSEGGGRTHRDGRQSWLDALEHALHDRRPVHRGALVHHSDRGSQYVSITHLLHFDLLND